MIQIVFHCFLHYPTIHPDPFRLADERTGRQTAQEDLQRTRELLDKQIVTQKVTFFKECFLSPDTSCSLWMNQSSEASLRALIVAGGLGTTELESELGRLRARLEAEQRLRPAVNPSVPVGATVSNAAYV